VNRQAGPRMTTGSLVAVSAMSGAVAGVLVTVLFLRAFPQWVGIGGVKTPAVTVVRGDEPPSTPPRRSTDKSPDKPVDNPPAISAPPAPTAPSRIDDGVPGLGPDSIGELRGRSLDVPVKGTPRSSLQDTFDDKRGDRVHEAIDILAPRNTPVIAIENGTIAKLFNSKAGGITLYQFDPDAEYVYYYAHLERYADGLKEGDKLKRGQVIGYVGTSGNAPKDTPHLHFAIFRLTDKKQWWQGTPLDPYQILK
jgi:murein DD-endopeptidase MepM/ murein hydrolase activator NlpD